MAKTIAVSDETYELLKKEQSEGESFSEIIKRGLKRRPSLMSIAGSGTLTKADWKKTQKMIKTAESKTREKLARMFG